MFKVHFRCNKVCKRVPLLKLTTASEYIPYKYTNTSSEKGSVGFLLVFVTDERVLCYAKRYSCLFLTWNWRQT